MITLVGLWTVTLLLITLNFLWDFAFGYKDAMSINQSWGMFNLALFCTALSWIARINNNEKNTNQSG